MGMTDDELNTECRYCYREVDASGLEGFRCTNKFINKSTSWCRPRNANKPCSTCEFCEIKNDKECLFYETCSSRTAVCKVRQPDMGCPVYRYFKGLIVKNNEAILKADIVAMQKEIDLQFDEICFCRKAEWKTVPEIKAEYKAVIQQKFNSLKEGTNQ